MKRRLPTQPQQQASAPTVFTLVNFFKTSSSSPIVVHVYPLSVFQDTLEGVTAAYRDARCGMYGNVYRSDSPSTEISDQDVGQLSLHSIICSASSPFLICLLVLVSNSSGCNRCSHSAFHCMSISHSSNAIRARTPELRIGGS
jgi:hypothetical protein